MHDIRRAAERSAQEELAASLGRQAGEARLLGEIDLTIARARAEVRAVPVGAPLPGLAPGAAIAYLERLAGNRGAAARRVAASEAEVGRRRQELDLAARERRALDRLHDRRRDEHLLAAARAEGARLDEFALAAHRRRTA